MPATVQTRSFARAFVLVALLALIGAFGWVPTPRAQEAEKPPSQVRLVLGTPPGSLAHQAAGLLARHLAALGTKVDVEHLSGDRGRDAARSVVQSFADPEVLLVAENLTLSIQDLRGVPLVKGLLPVAKLSTGVSTVLFVAGTSPVADWEQFVTAARRKRLKAASNGRISDVSLPLAMIERRWGVRFQDVDTPDASRLTNAVAEGAADFAIATTDQLRAWNAIAAPEKMLRPLLTFGAERSASFPETPTLAEMGRDRRLAFTLSFGVYSPLGVPANTLAAWRAAALAASTDAAVLQEAAAQRFPLSTGGPDVLRDTLARDKRIAEAVVSATGTAR